MAWTVYADELQTSDMVSTDKSCRLIPKETVAVVAARTWIVVLGSPDFSNLHMKIYADDTGAVGELLYTSTNAFSKTEIITEAHGVREIYFEFDHVVLSGSSYYHFVLNCDGYAHLESKHLAWKKAWPDPVYEGFTPTLENLSTAPYALYLYGGAF